MEISIKLHATLARYMPANPCRIHVCPHSSIQDVLHTLGIPEETNRILLVFVNAIMATDFSMELHNGDEIKVFLALGGG